MRLSPLLGSTPADCITNSAPVRAFPLTPPDKLFEPFSQHQRGSQHLLGSFLTPLDRPVPVVENHAAVHGLPHRLGTFDNTQHLTSDAPIRPVLPRLTTWPCPHVDTKKRPAENEAGMTTESEIVSNTRYGRRDLPDESAADQDYSTVAEIPQRQQPVTTSSTSSASPPLVSKPAKTTRRREQCRANQARYRERQKDKLWIKEEEVARLRELVNLLEAQRSMARTGSGRFAFAQHVVVEMFRRFRGGLSGPRPSFTAQSVGSTSKVQSAKSDKARHVGKSQISMKQIAFIQTVIDKDANVGHGRRGPDAVLEQCWQHSTIFANLKLELISVKQEYCSDPQTERVMVTGSVKAKLTHQTINRLFPDLPPGLLHMLRGRTLNFGLRLRLDLEEASMTPLLQVTKLHAEMDVVPALLAVLGDRAAVERVMRYACISSDGVIRELETMGGMRWD